MPSILEKMIDEAFGQSPEEKSVPTARTTRVPVGVGSSAQVRITSPYGQRVHPVTHQKSFHAGTDIAGKVGDPVYAIADGVVISVKTSSTAGLYITISHGNRLLSKYMHLSGFMVKVGQKVAKGQRIGSVGKTGRVTGPHLHLEIWQDGSHVRPSAQQAAIASGKSIAGDT